MKCWPVIFYMTSHDNVYSFDFNIHLQDVFHIIRYLQQCKDRASDVDCFVWLIHRRAFRKLSWRVMRFDTQFKESPFHLLKSNIGLLLDSMSETSFSIQLPPSLHRQVEVYVCATSKEEARGQSKVTYQYWLGRENVAEWIEFLQTIWQQLQSSLLEETNGVWKIPMEPPDNEDTTFIVLAIAIFSGLRHVIRHLFQPLEAVFIALGML